MCVWLQIQGSRVRSRSGPILSWRLIMKWFLRSFSSLPLIHSRRVVVSYKRKYVHEILVNRLFKPAQEKVWLLRWTDRPAMTIAVDLGRKANKQTISTLLSKMYLPAPLSCGSVFWDALKPEPLPVRPSGKPTRPVLVIAKERSYKQLPAPISRTNPFIILGMLGCILDYFPNC